MSDVETDYAAWARAYGRPNDADRAAMLSHIGRFSNFPRFVLVPLVRAGDTPGMWLPVPNAIPSQIYCHWEAVLPGEWGSAGADLSGVVRLHQAATPFPEPEGERRAFLASVIAEAGGTGGDFIVPLLPGAVLDERALYEFAVASVRAPKMAVLYGDEDEIDQRGGTPRAPRFKTDFDPELILGRDSLGLPVAYVRRLLEQLDGLREGVGPIENALHDLALRASELVQPCHFFHVPIVLCHRIRPAGNASEWDSAAARRAVGRHLDVIGEVGAQVHPAPLAPAWCRVSRCLPETPPLVSVILPTRDRADLLARCSDALLRRTDYPALELLIVDNGSEALDTLSLLAGLEAEPRVRVLRRPGPFNFSALNNAAAREATGEMLLLLNNDTDVLSPGWLHEMVVHALRPGVGAVGAKLVYADDRIQHAGVVLGRGQMIAHQLRLSPRDDPGPQGELALARTVLGVTGACLAIQRHVFWEVGGLDENAFPVAFGDIDLCLRLRDHGYRVVWTPFAELLHLESASRGDDQSDPGRRARFLNELGAFGHRWAPDMRDDPFHNPNVDYGWNCTRLAAPPRRAHSWVA